MKYLLTFFIILQTYCYSDLSVPLGFDEPISENKKESKKESINKKKPKYDSTIQLKPNNNINKDMVVRLSDNEKAVASVIVSENDRWMLEHMNSPFAEKQITSTGVVITKFPPKYQLLALEAKTEAERIKYATLQWEENKYKIEQLYKYNKILKDIGYKNTKIDDFMLKDKEYENKLSELQTQFRNSREKLGEHTVDGVKVNDFSHNIKIPGEFDENKIQIYWFFDVDCKICSESYPQINSFFNEIKKKVNFKGIHVGEPGRFIGMNRKSRLYGKSLFPYKVYPNLDDIDNPYIKVRHKPYSQIFGVNEPGTFVVWNVKTNKIVRVVKPRNVQEELLKVMNEI